MNFERLTPDEITRSLQHVPKVVLDQVAREDVVIAGGIIRDTVAGVPVKDVDIFCHSAEQAERLSREFAGPFLHVPKTLFAYTVQTLGLPVQYVYYKEYADAQALISQFDFRACCAGIWWGGLGCWLGWAVEGFRGDCLSKTLRFMSQEKDAGKLTALGRALHLAKRGWELSTEEASAIISHWQPLADPAEVRRSFRPHYGRV